MSGIIDRVYATNERLIETLKDKNAELASAQKRIINLNNRLYGPLACLHHAKFLAAENEQDAGFCTLCRITELESARDKLVAGYKTAVEEIALEADALHDKYWHLYKVEHTGPYDEGRADSLDEFAQFIRVKFLNPDAYF